MGKSRMNISGINRKAEMTVLVMGDSKNIGVEGGAYRINKK